MHRVPLVDCCVACEMVGKYVKLRSSSSSRPCKLHAAGISSAAGFGLSIGDERRAVGRAIGKRVHQEEEGRELVSRSPDLETSRPEAVVANRTTRYGDANLEGWQLSL